MLWSMASSAQDPTSWCRIQNDDGTSCDSLEGKRGALGSAEGKTLEMAMFDSRDGLTIVQLDIYGTIDSNLKEFN